MAMTKKEQAALAEALSLVKITRALHWTPPVERDVPPPKSGGKASEGWDVIIGSLSVYSYSYGTLRDTLKRAWSCSDSHGDYNAKGVIGSSRKGSKELFSTKRKAMLALRYQIALQAAKQLAEIDEMIDQCDRVYVAQSPKSPEGVE